MAMTNYIILPSQFIDDQNGIYFDIPNIIPSRIFIGCGDNIAHWSEIMNGGVRIWCSALPVADVYVIIETGAR